MLSFKRRVEPEVLDSLSPEDPKAIRARRDLRRVHVAMRSLSILKRAIDELPFAVTPRRIIELGAGDGSLMLRLARSLRSKWTGVELTLLDRVDVVDPSTRQAYQQLGWTVQARCEDVFAWADSITRTSYDLCVVNLFLHHFDNRSLAHLLKVVADRTDAFVACEPRRDPISRWSSRCIGLLGCNSVTREDAVKSVEAGFNHQELSDCWERFGGSWIVRETRAYPFTHCFSAMRRRNVEVR